MSRRFLVACFTFLVALLAGPVSPSSGAANLVIGVPAPNPTEFQGLPTLDEGDGRFLLVTGPGNFSIPGVENGGGRLVLNLQFPLTATSVEVLGFDADTVGLWDQERFTDIPLLKYPDTVYSLYADGTGLTAQRLLDGNPANDPVPVATIRASDISPLDVPPPPDGVYDNDAVWSQLFQRAPDVDANAGDEFRYVVTATLEVRDTQPDPQGRTKGRELNGFKLAFNGTYTLPVNSVMGIVGGTVNTHFEVVGGSGELREFPGDPENSYDGTFEFPFDPSPIVCIGDINFFEADADWNVPIPQGTVDTNPTGIPPDDGGKYKEQPTDLAVHDSSAMTISPQVLWEVLDPNGAVTFSSSANAPAGHPSITSTKQTGADAPYQSTLLSGAIFRSKPAGLWTLRWRGLDRRNFVFMRFNVPFGTRPKPGKVQLKSYCDDNSNGVMDPGESGIAGTLVVTRLPATVFPPLDVPASGLVEGDLPPGDYQGEFTVHDARYPVLDGTVVLKDFSVQQQDCQGTTATLDLPFHCGRSVCGRVWCDKNANGLFDALTETPLANVTVLFDALVNGVPLTLDAQTDAVGQYCIDLPLGTWTARIDLADAGNGIPANWNLRTVQPIPIGSGAQADVNFLFDCPTPRTVCGRLYCERNNQPGFNAGDFPLPNFPVEVKRVIPSGPNAGQIERPDNDPITTDADGLWCADLPNTETGWTVSVDTSLLPSRWMLLTTQPLPIGDGAPQNLDLVFKCPDRVVCGHVFCDVNQNGQFDAGIDDVHSNVTVKCHRTDVNTGQDIEITDETDITGEWCIPLPDDEIDWLATVDVNDAQLLGDTLTSAETLPVGAGEPKDLDFLFSCPGRLSGHVFKEKLDCLGRKSADDVGIEGVLVLLVRLENGEPVAGTEQTDTTDAQGFYSFDDLQAGDYRLTVSTNPPQEVLVGLNRSGQEFLTPAVQIRTETPDNDFFYCEKCTCKEQSTDCVSGYHLIELEVDVIVKCPCKEDWTNPSCWNRTPDCRDGSDSKKDCAPTKKDCKGDSKSGKKGKCDDKSKKDKSKCDDKSKKSKGDDKSKKDKCDDKSRKDDKSKCDDKSKRDCPTPKPCPPKPCPPEPCPPKPCPPPPPPCPPKPCPPPPPPPKPCDCSTITDHTVEVSTSGGTVKLSFSGDEWHGAKQDRLLIVTDAWRVKDCHFRVRIKIWACDVRISPCDDGMKRGCLGKGCRCVNVNVDCTNQKVCLDLSGCTCLTVGAVTDRCGNPWYSILRWVSCKDAECCPPHPCCIGTCACRPPPCGCSRK